MAAVLPEADVEDLPTGFSIVGHVGKCTKSLTPHTHTLILRETSAFESEESISSLQISRGRGINGQEPYRTYSHQQD